MVNMKASLHQGERKRNQATLGDGAAVSKLEKQKLRPDAVCVNADGIPLRVLAREKVLGGESNAHVKAALVSAETFAQLANPGGNRTLLSRPGGDFILSARAHEGVEPGTVLLGEAQRLSLHVCEDESYEWVPFKPAAADGDEAALALLSIEAQLLTAPKPGEGAIEIDAIALGRDLAKRFFDEIVSDNEIFMYTFNEIPLVFVGPSTVFKSSSSQKAVCEGLKLLNVQKPPERAPKNCVHVSTSDGETFPVHRTLLRPCISLTKAVRDTKSEAPVGVDVQVDCATFDRVLLFLEAASRNLHETFAFDMLTLPNLSLAANALGCRPLKEACAKKLGSFEERIAIHRWADIVAHNKAGGCMVTMDGMIFDLAAWLPEHPGGATIIPQQALNIDCTVFFELYHASRESFTYLKEFYVGELTAEDRELVPHGAEKPSADFMSQLREFSAPFRYTPDVVTHKSF